jgi:protein subunit release factor B
MCQTERSQLGNRMKAMTMLRTKLYEDKVREQEAAVAAHRKSQVSSGDRSAKIRTYNFPQSRVTDHRIEFTVHNLPPGDQRRSAGDHRCAAARRTYRKAEGRREVDQKIRLR